MDRSTKNFSISASRTDAKLLLRALIELNIARKNMMSYPEGHHQVAASSQRAFQHLRTVLDHLGELSIGVAREGLLITDQFLEPDHAVIKDLSSALHDRRVARIEIDAGLSPKDTLSFLYFITAPAGSMPPDSAHAGNSSKSVHFNSVHVQFIDYSLFQHTNVLDATGLSATGPDAQRSMWHDYVRLLGSISVLSDSPAGTPIAKAPQPTPKEIAKFVNLKAASDPTPLKCFDTVIQDHLRHDSARSIPNTSKHESKEQLKQFIENLNPNLRKQFLSIAFDNIKKYPKQSTAERFLTDLHYSIVVKMLTQANADGEEISPTLLNFLRKLDGSCGLQDRKIGQHESAVQVEELRRLQAIMPDGGVLRREAYEAYINPDYDRTLQSLIPNQRGAISADTAPFDTKSYIESMSERSVTLRLGQIFLSLLTKKTHPDTYREHALNLMAVVEDLARLGANKLVLNILQLFRAHGEENQTAPIGVIAQQCLEEMCSPRIINAVLDAICQNEHGANTVQLDLMISLGPSSASEAFNRFLTCRSPTLKDLIRKIAAAFPHKVAAELAYHLHKADPDEFLVLQEIVILLSTDRIESLLQPFLDHKDRRIKLAALAVLVGNKHAEASRRLESLLDSRDPTILKVATSLIEKYGMREMVPVLMRILGRGFLLFKKDLDKTEKILTTIIRIADPLPREELERVLRRKLSIHPGRLRQIRASLKDVPKDLTKRTKVPACHSPSRGAAL